MENGQQIASVAGYVSQVNRLVTVTPLRQIYHGKYFELLLVVFIYLTSYLGFRLTSLWIS